MILSGFAHGQNFILPYLAADSAYYEIVKGRHCEKVLYAQLSATTKLQTELLAQGKIIQLKKNEVTHLEEIIALIQKESQADKTIAKEKIHALKVKIRKLVAVVIGETGFVVLLVVLLL